LNKVREQDLTNKKECITMDAAAQISHERRHANYDKANLWDKLSLTQKFSATSLTQFGYDLAFLRKNSGGSIAVLLYNDSIATVNDEGEIDTCPNISIR